MLLQNSGGLFNKFFARLTFVAVLLMCAAQPFAHAQSAGTASIQGTVADPSGAAIPNAHVTFINTETSTSRATVSDGAGIFSLPNVPVGPYSLTVAAPGFQGFVQKGVLEVGTNVQINPALTVGSA